MPLSSTEAKIVFIGGLHRSGTTLLAECLGKHSLISGFSNTGANENEGQFLQSVYPDDNKHGGPGRFAFDSREHLTEDSPLVSSENRELLFADWSRHWELERPHLLEKSPANLIRSRFLQKLFPNSCFIFILRHPVAVSFATQKWSGTSLYSLMHHWVLAHETLRDDLVFLDRYVIVKYETLVQRFDEEVKRIFSFLGVSSEPIHMAPQQGLNARYFTRWTAAETARDAIPRTRRRQKFILRKAYNKILRPVIKRDLMSQGCEIIDLGSDKQDAIAVFEERVRRFGYSLSDLERVSDWRPNENPLQNAAVGTVFHNRTRQISTRT